MRDIMQPAMEPFIKLAQANIELWSRVSYSPEIASEAIRNVQMLLVQTQTAVANVAQSRAFTEFMQGLLENYAVFLSDLSQGAYSALLHGQASYRQNAPDAVRNVVEITNPRARRVLQAA